jgi:hypothetical protein
MKLIKLAIISFIVFFIIITGFSLLIPSNVRISRAINIKSDKEKVMELIKDTTRWKEWNPIYGSPSPGLRTAFIQVTDTLVTTALRQDNKQPVINGWQMHSIPGADSLTLQWFMDFHLKWYPWKKFESLFFDKIYGKAMETGLARLKGIVEKQ